MKRNKNCHWMVVGLTCFVTLNAFAEREKKQLLSANTATKTPFLKPATSTISTKSETTATVPVITGMLDMRAGYFSKSGKSDTENAVELGVKLTPTTSLSYLQAFNTSVYNSPDTTNGQTAILDAGFIRGKINNIWQSDNKETAFSFEQRIYLSNAFFQKDIDMITISRSYFKLSQKLSTSVTFNLMEVPILFVSRSAGVRDAANPIFENRFYLSTDISLTKNLSLSLPVIFHQTRFSNYKPGAKNNDTWAYVLWVNPELDYTINENVTVGVAYSNWSNLVASDLSKTNFAAGFEDGIYQAIVTFKF